MMHTSRLMSLERSLRLCERMLVILGQSQKRGASSEDETFSDIMHLIQKMQRQSQARQCRMPLMAEEAMS